VPAGEADPPPPERPLRPPVDLTPQALRDRLAAVCAPRTAVVCIGNALRGDDALGPVVAERLANAAGWQVFDAATAPESFLMPVVRARPDCVLVVDALDLGAAPGTIRLLGPDELTGAGPSTHGPAPTAFLRALGMAHSCRRLVLGVQPGGTQLGEPLSPAVAAAAEAVAEAIRSVAAAQRM
jgi:hydrogenase 3 maturation protease